MHTPEKRFAVAFGQQVFSTSVIAKGMGCHLSTIATVLKQKHETGDVRIKA